MNVAQGDGGWQPASASTIELYNKYKQTQFSNAYGGGGYGSSSYFSPMGQLSPFDPYSPRTNAYNQQIDANGFKPIGAPAFIKQNAANKVSYAVYGPNQAKDGAKAAQAAQAEEAKKAADAKKAEPKTITVKQGDNLTKLAKTHGISVDRLYYLNKSTIGRNPNLIKPGQVFKLE